MRCYLTGFFLVGVLHTLPPCQQAAGIGCCRQYCAHHRLASAGCAVLQHESEELVHIQHIMISSWQRPFNSGLVRLALHTQMHEKRTARTSRRLRYCVHSHQKWTSVP